MNVPLDLAERLRAHVSTLASAPRVPGSAEHAAARRYVRRHLETAGFQVDEVKHQEAGCAAINLLTKPIPALSDLPLVVIAAHYDTVADSPGADDNASGIAALLEIGAALSARLAPGNALTARLQLVAYDLEEYGLIGSCCHSRALKCAGEAIRGMCSLEMLGYIDQRAGSQRLPPNLAGLYPHVGNFIGVCANEASRPLLQECVQALKTVPGLPVEHIAVPGKGEVLPEVRLSDHRSFWDNEFPAVMISDTSFFRNPHYHQASDRPETLHYGFLAKVTTGLIEAVWRLVTCH